MPKKNEVRIPIKVDGKEILLTKKQVEKLNKSLDKTGTSAHTADRRLKGAAQTSSGASKNFSKMAQGITGGLVPAYATLAANIFAIGAAFRFLQDAANYRILIQGQQEYATVTGESLKLLTSRLQDATGQQLAFAEAAQSAAIGRAAGLSSDQLSRLGSVAKNASIALGRDLTDSFNRLVRGSTKGEPELLDELGIILRLETATERYGQAIGKTKDELSAFERSQAVTNEVLRQGEEKFQDFGTELNAFTKLAKSFDDLINKIKSSLTGVAEFLAGALSKNVFALGGAFALLGTGIAKAITPAIPNIDLGKAAGKATADVGKFYTGKNLSKFESGSFGKGDIQKLERSMSVKKSTVLNFETFRRQEAQKTVAILKAYNLQIEADGKGSFTKMKASFLANLYIMQAEYGKWAGTMKFLGAGLTQALSFIGYAGMLLSLVGVFQTLLDKFKDPAVLKFEEDQKKLLDVFTEQNTELEKLHENLKTSAGFFDSLVQRASFLSNFSFKNLTEGFEGFESAAAKRQADEDKYLQNLGLKGGNLPYEEGTDEYNKNMKEARASVGLGDERDAALLSSTQIDIINQSIKSMQLMQKELDTSSDSYDDLSNRIQRFVSIIHDNEGNTETGELPGLDRAAYAQMAQDLLDLEKNSTKAQESFNKFAQANRIVKDSVVEYNKAMTGLKVQSGPLAILMKQVGTMEDAFNEILNSDLKQLSDEAAAEYLKTMSSAQEAAVKTMIGSKAYEQAIKDAGEDNIKALELLRGLLEERRDTLQKAAEAAVLDQKGIALLSKKAQIGATPLQIKTIKNLESQRQLEREIIAAKEIQVTFDKAGADADKVAKAQNEQKLLDLQFQLELIRLQKDELYLLGQAARKAFEGGMTTAFDDLITGKEGSLKEAMGKVAKGVFSGISKELSGQLSESVSNFMFGDKKLDPYKQGAMIIKQAHIEGIREGLGSNSPTLTMNSETGQDSGFLGKAFGTVKSLFGFAKGGVTPEYAKGGVTPVYAATGGVFSGSKQGYPAIMHGNEAVVPLPDGKSIPVSGGMGGTVNVSVNMATGETSSTSNAEDMYQMGTAIAQAVENELEKQQRPGGMLAPY